MKWRDVGGLLLTLAGLVGCLLIAWLPGLVQWPVLVGWLIVFPLCMAALFVLGLTTCVILDRTLDDILEH